MKESDIIPWASLALALSAIVIAVTLGTSPAPDNHLDSVVADLERRVGVLNGTTAGLSTDVANEAKGLSTLRSDLNAAMDVAAIHETSDYQTLESAINAQHQTADQKPMSDSRIRAMQRQLRAVDQDLTVLFNHEELRRLEGSKP